MKVTATDITSEHKRMHNFMSDDITLVHKESVAQSTLEQWCA